MGADTAAVAVAGLTGATAIAAGPGHACALQAGGTVACWGSNVAGQLGDGTTTSSDTAVQVVGLTTTAIAIAAGGDAGSGPNGAHTCAALADGTVECWGSDSLGQLGTGSVVSAPVATPVVVPGITRASALYAAPSGNTICAVVAEGAVECWGKQPSVVAGLTAPAAIAVGDDHACALLADTTVACWGGNAGGELGNGTVTSSATPVAVKGLTGVTAITAATDDTCALLAGGTVKCWGDNSFGSLGTAGRTPIAVMNVSGATAIAAYYQTCAVIAGGAVDCWGDDDYGQLGVSAATALTPGPVTGLTGATAITAGRFHTCALLAAGTVECWGDNGAGELGTGTASAGPTLPVVSPSLSGVIAIAAGPRFTCAVVAGGSVDCWGEQELANGTTSTVLSPTAVPGVTGATAIAAGGDTSGGYACALLSAGTVECWGAIASSSTPVAVPGLTGVTAIASGTGHMCALISDGTVDCWGTNEWGQLGNGQMSSAGVLTAKPAKVLDLKGAVGVAAGGSHSCAALQDGTARCWGVNGGGELGDGSADASAIPVVVSGLTGAVSIVGGDAHTCAVIADGTVECWGDNSLGQLANGTTTPVPVLGL